MCVKSLFLLLCCVYQVRMEDTSCGGDSVFSRLSAYNPLNSSATDYFTKDLHSQSLKTLQDYLKGNAAYVTVAMDAELVDKQVPYGMVICIPKLNEKFGKKIRFEVRDTRAELNGLGFNRIAICVDSVDDAKDEAVNSLVNVRLPAGTVTEETPQSNDNMVEAPNVNYAGLREDYRPEQRSPQDYGYNYPPYYYYPEPKKTTTTPKPYHYPPYPYPNPYYQAYPPYPPYYYYPPTTKKTTTAKPYYPYYPPANPHYYYPPAPSMYGYSNGQYNSSSYDYPMPNYKPVPAYYPSRPSYPAYYPPSSSYNTYDQSSSYKSSGSSPY